MTTLRLASPWAYGCMLLMVAVSSASCGGDDDDDTGDDAGAGASANGGAGIGGGGSSGNGGDASEGGAASLPAALNGCRAALYEDRTAADAERTIVAAGVSYTPKCITIAAGQSVRWQGSLTAHPLAPGNPSDAAAGSADSPIVPTASGQAVEFTFETAGSYPYHCTVHAFGAGMGMAGVVHVR